MMIRSWRPLRHLAVLVVALTAVVSPDLASQGPRGRGASVMIDGREAVEGEVLVRFRDPAAAFERARAEEEIEADEVEPVGRRGTRRMRARRLGTREMLARLSANPDVEFVEPNYIIRLAATPNDPSFGNLWGLFNFGQSYGGVGIAGADIDATLAWDLSTGTRATVVGIVDTGIDYNHPDLAANIWTAPFPFSVTVGGVVINCAAGTHGFNAITNTCNPMDDNNHGTHVAGTIGAVGNNGVGVAGVNWTASMMGLKFLGSSGSGTTANAIKAIEFAVQAKAVLGTGVANVRVLSNSWGGGGYSQSLLDEINRTNTYDMLFVAAAGNSGLNADFSPMYPAAYSAPNIISVAATDNRDQRASFSNYGAATVDLGAPGVAILSTTRNNGYAAFNGTSMATPQVAGAAALLLSACSLTTGALKSALLASVDPIASMSGITTTGGRLNVNNAIRGCAVTANPLPAVSSLAPARIPIGSPSFTLYVEGTGFVAQSEVWIDGAPRATAFVAPTRLTATILASDLASLGTRAITVLNPAPGGGTSGSATLTVTPPLGMTVNSTSGAVTVLTGSTLSVVVTNGPANPMDYLTVVPAGSPSNHWTGVYQFLNGTTTVPNPGISNATVSVPAPATPGAYELRFLADGWYTRLATSGVITVTTPNPVPVLTSVAPASVVAGGAGFSLTVSGTGFTSTSQVQLNGSARSTTYVSPTVLTAAIAASDIASVGTRAVTVFNPAPGGGTSGSVALTILTPPPAPVLTGISPTTLAALGDAATLTVTGANFTSSSQVQIDGSARATTLVSSTILTAIVTASDRAAAGTRVVRVVTPAPGGGASATAALAIVAATVGLHGNQPWAATGSMMSVYVTNGPANPMDYVTIVPVGSPSTHWTGTYRFLNGTTTAPNPGLSGGTVNLPAPLTPGNYEIRFNANGWYTRLATSYVIAVVPPNPLPTLSSLTPDPVVAGGPAFSLTVTGTGFRATSQVAVNGSPRVTTYLSPTMLSAAIEAGDIASVGTPAITVINPWFDVGGGGTSGSRALRVVASLAAAPGMTVNGSTGPITVTAGSAMSVVITNGPANQWDYLTVVPVGSPNDLWTGVYQFLNGTTTLPQTGLSNATVSVPAPTTPGMYEVRFLENGWFTRLATSGVITVTAPPGPGLTVNGSSGSLTVTGGSMMSVVVTNGPANAWDYLTVVPVGSPNDLWTGVYQFLNGTTVAPNPGLANATVNVPAPSSAGLYEVRFFADGWYTRLATSGAITVTP